MTNEMVSSTAGSSDNAAVLDPVELRVLAVLAEKEGLTPDNYPMSLNAIVNGCNQLSSRDPVMQLSDDIVLDTLQRLTERKLVNAISQAGARVVKYEHRMRIKWTLEQDKLAVLTILMLRGLIDHAARQDEQIERLTDTMRAAGLCCPQVQEGDKLDSEQLNRLVD